MNALKNLFFLNYYARVLDGKNKFRWILAILILAALIAIQPSIFVVTKMYPVARNLENKVTAFVNDVYPKELEIKIKNGIATTNVTEPYYLVVRQETLNNLLSLQEDNQNTVSKIRLLAIDTKGKAEDFEQYQTLAFLTQTSLVYQNDDKINIQSLREIEDLTINKEIILAKIKELNKNYNISNLLNIFVFAAPILIVLGIFSSHIFLFLFMSIAVYIMVRISEIQTGFKNTYRYTVAVAFVPMFLWNIASFVPIIGRNLGVIRTILTIIILVIAHFGIKRLKQEEAVPPLETQNKEMQTVPTNPEIKSLEQSVTYLQRHSGDPAERETPESLSLREILGKTGTRQDSTIRYVPVPNRLVLGR